MEQLLGRQPKLSNKDSIHSLFLFMFLVILFVAVFFFCWDENSNRVLTLFVIVSVLTLFVTVSVFPTLSITLLLYCFILFIARHLGQCSSQSLGVFIFGLFIISHPACCT